MLHDLGILAKHALTRTRRIDDDEVKKVAQVAEAFGVVVGDDDVLASPTGNIFLQHLSTVAHDLIGNQQAVGAQAGGQQGAFARRAPRTGRARACPA